MVVVWNSPFGVILYVKPPEMSRKLSSILLLAIWRSQLSYASKAIVCRSSSVNDYFLPELPEPPGPNDEVILELNIFALLLLKSLCKVF